MAKEATLQDIADILMATQKTEEKSEDLLKDLSKSLGAFMKNMQLLLEKATLAEEERRRESTNRHVHEPQRLRPESLPESLNPKGILASAFGGTFLGEFLFNIGRTILKPLKPFAGIFSSLKGLMRFAVTLKGLGIIGIITGLYYIFKDIGSNPKFQEALDRMRDIWNNKVLPTWAKLVSKFQGLLETEEIEGSIRLIQGIWQKMTNWFNNTLKPLFQELFINTLNEFGSILSVFLDGISDLLDGDWSTLLIDLPIQIGKSLLNLAGDLIAKFLNLFGIGVPGSLHDKITAWISDLGAVFDQAILDIKTFFLSYIPEKFVELKDKAIASITDWFADMITKVDEALGISDTFAYLKVKAEEYYTKITGAFTDFLDYIVSLPGKILDYTNSLIPDWLKDPKNTNTNDVIDENIRSFNDQFTSPKYILPRPQFDTRVPGNPDLSIQQQNMNDINKFLGYQPPTSAEKLQFFENERKNMPGANVAIAQDNRSTNTYSSNSTSIMSFAGSINEYGPQ